MYFVGKINFITTRRVTKCWIPAALYGRKVAHYCTAKLWCDILIPSFSSLVCFRGLRRLDENFRLPSVRRKVPAASLDGMALAARLFQKSSRHPLQLRALQLRQLLQVQLREAHKERPRHRRRDHSHVQHVRLSQQVHVLRAQAHQFLPQVELEFIELSGPSSEPQQDERDRYVEQRVVKESQACNIWSRIFFLEELKIWRE